MALRDLKTGMRGADVKALQQGLNTRDGGVRPRLSEDGVFGPRTDAAVREYQTRHGLKADGIVGRRTRASIFPIGVATVGVFGMRLRMPEPPRFGPAIQPPRLLPGGLQLQMPGGASAPLDGTFRSRLAGLAFQPLWLPRLPQPMPAPVVPDWNLSIPPLPGTHPSRPFGFQYDHIELQPGGQSTFNFGDRRPESVFTLTMQTIYRRGRDDGPHQEAQLGVQIGMPITASSSTGSPWTFNPFITLTDVDRFGTLGQFHFWQPYAQLGPQFSGPGDPHPTLSLSLFPVNLGLDAGDILTIGLGAGFAASLDLQTGRVQAGGQLTVGISLKLGRPGGPL